MGPNTPNSKRISGEVNVSVNGNTPALGAGYSAGGVNPILKGEQSCLKELAVVGSGAAGASASVMRGVTEMLARLALTVFLLIVLVVLAYEAIRLDGLAAPILGR